MQGGRRPGSAVRPPRLRRTSPDRRATSRTYDPRRRLKVARAAGRSPASSRCWSPCTCTLVVGLIGLLGPGAQRPAGRPSLAAWASRWWPRGTLAAVLTTAREVAPGRAGPGRRPPAVELVRVAQRARRHLRRGGGGPWFARVVTGTPLLTWWFRSMGAQVGRGVWCETYWLPEPDLVQLGDGPPSTRAASCRPTCSTTGCWPSTRSPSGAARPSARTRSSSRRPTIGRHATVGPVSLVMRGETVPDKTVWIGNPIGPWARRARRRRGSATFPPPTPTSRATATRRTPWAATTSTCDYRPRPATGSTARHDCSSPSRERARPPRARPGATCRSPR